VIPLTGALPSAMEEFVALGTWRAHDLAGGG
jgi:hypothetical protein